MDKLISKYKHIIWDWNGTLLDDVSVAINVMNSVLNKRNLPLITLEYYKDIFGFPVIDYYKRLGFDFSQEPFELISQEFIIAYDNCCYYCRLHTGAEAVLNAVMEAGISQSILSAAHQDHLERFIEYFNIRHYFVKLIGLNHIHATSKVENGVKWISSLPCNPMEVLLIGDTSHDYEVSKAIGCDCILLASGHHSAEKLKTFNVPVYNSLHDLIPLCTIPAYHISNYSTNLTS